MMFALKVNNAYLFLINMRGRTSTIQTECGHPSANQVPTADLSVEADGTVIRQYSKCVKTGLPVYIVSSWIS